MVGNAKLDKVIASYGEEYEGTDPVKDSAKIHKEDYMKKLGICKVESKYCVVDHKNKGEAGDPFDIYGHGIKSYFTMMWTLVLVFLGLSILFVPVVINYY